MDYPFIKCLRPKYILNKYTGQTVLASCNHCDACKNSRSYQLTKLITLQAEESRYTMFVTLTFNSKYIPYVTPFYEDDRTLFLYHGSTRNKFINENGLVLGDDESPFSDYRYDDPGIIHSLIDKSELGNDRIAVLDKYHLQLFLKRFRYYCKKYKIYEKVHSYGVGEYGPKSFRPHFHLLFFFDSPRLLSLFREILYKAWKFGFINFSSVRSSGKAARYVAKYFNSSSNLPLLFKTKAFKPFAVHSNFFAASFFTRQGHEIYQLDFRQVIESLSPVGNRIESISCWRNITNCLFPKVRGFSRRSDSELFKLYTIYKTCVSVFGSGKTITEYVGRILDSDLPYFDFLLADIVLTDRGYEKILRSVECISHDLYVSKHFLTNIVPSVYGDRRIFKNGVFHKVTSVDPYGNVMAYIHKFKDFYSLLELQRLKFFYKSQAESVKYGLDYRYFYDNFSASFNIKENPYFSAFNLTQSMIAVNAVKHKSLNDLNNIFKYR